MLTFLKDNFYGACMLPQALSCRQIDSVSESPFVHFLKPHADKMGNT